MSLFSSLLYLHIAAGTTSLLMGLVVLFLRKSDRRHKLLGNIYFFSLLIASIVAIPMSYLHANAFLFIVSIFTIYMLLTGRRYIRKKSAADVTVVDWSLSTVMAIFGVAFIGFGCFHLLRSNTFGTVWVVFGLIGCLFVYQDWVNYRGKSGTKNFYLTTHLQRFIGSYIATVTAFLVVNNTWLPGTIAWLLPTVLLVPLIVWWSRKYRVARLNN